MNFLALNRWSRCLFIVGLCAGSVRAAESTPSPDARVRAANTIEQAAQVDPANPELWLHLGFARQKLGDTDAAQQAFGKAAALDPKNLDALYMLGLIDEKKHQTQEAIRVWKQYLAASPRPEKRELAEKHIHQLSQ